MKWYRPKYLLHRLGLRGSITLLWQGVPFGKPWQRVGPSIGQQLTDAFVRGLTEEPTGTPEERAEATANMFAHAELVAHRAFGALYEDDDDL